MRKTATTLGATVAAATVMVWWLLLGQPATSREGPPPKAPAGPPAPVATATYVGREKCLDCHEQTSHTFDKTPMGTAFRIKPRTVLQAYDCEACHGPGSAHVDDTSMNNTLINFGPKWKSPTEVQNRACLQCHDGGRHTFWMGSAHQMRSIGCTSCHTVMHQVSDRAMLSKPTAQELCTTCHLDKYAKSWRQAHMPEREGKLDCTVCHDPHGTPSEHEVRADTSNELCYKCHADIRGPFLWEHAPVKENCMTCHDAHGSIHDSMLKVKAERLCQQCHVEVQHPSQPHSPFSRFVFNQSCLNCHALIHGSNHPAGNLFLR